MADISSAEDEKRRADQLGLNCKWLVDKIDRIHAKLCPGQHGTWQQRAEQAVEAAESLPQLDTANLLAITEWIGGRDTGVSSKYMASVALVGKVIKAEWGDSTPSDAPDLGRCVRLIERVPGVRRTFPVLRQASPVWAAYVDHWDELTALWHQGDYHVTTDRMNDLREAAGNSGTES